MAQEGAPTREALKKSGKIQKIRRQRQMTEKDKMQGFLVDIDQRRTLWLKTKLPKSRRWQGGAW